MLQNLMKPNLTANTEKVSPAKTEKQCPPNCGGFSLFLHHLWGKYENGAWTHPPLFSMMLLSLNILILFSECHFAGYRNAE